jgi:Calcium-dependent channel, 7TM region, putative phosphate
MFLLYLAFRYNTFFVFTTRIDTRGACYSRALQQLLTGVYISALCLIGIFGTRTAWGPFVLMIVFLVGTVLIHISLNAVLSPLETWLPADIQADDEHEAIRALEDGADHRHYRAPDHQHQHRSGRKTASSTHSHRMGVISDPAVKRTARHQHTTSIPTRLSQPIFPTQAQMKNAPAPSQNTLLPKLQHAKRNTTPNHRHHRKLVS